MENQTALEVKIAHLAMIQGVIARMAGDGQTMKTLAITMSAAVVALAPSANVLTFWLAITGILAVGVFWWQTAYHLHIERAYRCLYDHVRENKPVAEFTMNWRDYRSEVDNPLKLATTPSVLVPFGGMLVVLVVLIVITMSGVGATQSNGANGNGTVVEQKS